LRDLQPKTRSETNAPCRAIHLLQILGHPLTENDKLTDVQFLSEVMEVQEEMETCGAEALRAHLKRNGARLQHERGVAAAAFASGRITDAKAVVIKMQCEPPPPPPLACPPSPSHAAPQIFE
jgi:hypothetical protein